MVDLFEVELCLLRGNYWMFMYYSQPITIIIIIIFIFIIIIIIIMAL
jgi:hypothetical protein